MILLTSLPQPRTDLNGWLTQTVLDEPPGPARLESVPVRLWTVCGYCRKSKSGACKRHEGES